jgi:glutamate dehydrogenase
VPDDPYLGRELERYFPQALRERFPDAIRSHRLRREIIATQLANAIVNRGGPNVVTRLADETGADAPTIAAAYATTRDSFGPARASTTRSTPRWAHRGALQLSSTPPCRISPSPAWSGSPATSISAAAARRRRRPFQCRDREVSVALGDALSPTVAQALVRPHGRACRGGRAAGPRSRLAALQDLVAAPDIVLVAGRTGRAVAEVARVHFAADDLFGLGELAGAASAIQVVDHYDRLARDRAVDALAAAHRRLTAEIVGRDGAPGPERVAAWASARGGEVERIRGSVHAIAASGLTVSKLTVAASLLADLAKE